MFSKRIKFLASLVENDCVYDLCCDHGFIGELSLQRKRSVIFVDQVQSITTVLDKKLQGHNYENYQIQTNSILDIDTFKDHSTIIIAGIGANLLESFLEKFTFNETQQLIISTHSNQHITHKAIFDSKLTKISEHLIEDNGKCYEIYVCKKLKGFDQTVSINKMFSQFKDSEYYRKQLNFYRFKQDNRVCSLLYQQLKDI